MTRPRRRVLPAVLPGRSLRTDDAIALLKQMRSEETPCLPLLRRVLTVRSLRPRRRTALADSLFRSYCLSGSLDFSFVERKDATAIQEREMVNGLLLISLMRSSHLLTITVGTCRTRHIVSAIITILQMVLHHAPHN